MGLRHINISKIIRSEACTAHVSGVTFHNLWFQFSVCSSSELKTYWRIIENVLYADGKGNNPYTLAFALTGSCLHRFSSFLSIRVMAISHVYRRNDLVNLWLIARKMSMYTAKSQFRFGWKTFAAVTSSWIFLTWCAALLFTQHWRPRHLLRNSRWWQSTKDHFCFFSTVFRLSLFISLSLLSLRCLSLDYCLVSFTFSEHMADGKGERAQNSINIRQRAQKNGK